MPAQVIYPPDGLSIPVGSPINIIAQTSGPAIISSTLVISDGGGNHFTLLGQLADGACGNGGDVGFWLEQSWDVTSSPIALCEGAPLLITVTFSTGIGPDACTSNVIYDSSAGGPGGGLLNAIYAAVHTTF